MKHYYLQACFFEENQSRKVTLPAKTKVMIYNNNNNNLKRLKKNAAAYFQNCYCITL